jgi:serine/threonine-protein kinase HipA
VDRFDRAEENRIGYVSAMTMLEAQDGQSRSYLEIAEIIEQQSASPTRELRELWSRIALSILISNTDDHLRNHGFLRAASGSWELSPAFDINPNPDPGPKHLVTAIDLYDTSANIELLLEVAPFFRLDHSQARTALDSVNHAVDSWRSVASGVGISAAEIEQMETAFEHEERTIAKGLARADS